MSLSGETKKTVALLLAVWPVMIGAGWLAGQVSGTQWPMSAMALGWLAVLFGVLSKSMGSDE
jgi:hypothetical protein